MRRPGNRFRRGWRLDPKCGDRVYTLAGRSLRLPAALCVAGDEMKFYKLRLSASGALWANEVIGQSAMSRVHQRF